MGSSLNWGSLLGSFFTRAPYDIGDPKWDPNAENCSNRLGRRDSQGFLVEESECRAANEQGFRV